MLLKGVADGQGGFASPPREVMGGDGFGVRWHVRRSGRGLASLVMFDLT